MKTTILLILLTASFSGTLNAQVADSLMLQTFEGTTFETDQIIGLENFEYNPTVADITLSHSSEQYIYGNLTTFKDGKFTSGNFGPCGNECRVTVSGTYHLEENQIHLFLETISFWKECSDQPTETINAAIGTFTWNKAENGTITLTREQ